MDSDDFSLIDIGHEDDSLLRNLLPAPDDTGRFACSPLVITGSAASSRPPKSILKSSVHSGEKGDTLPDSNKENSKGSCNMTPGSSNLSIEPQKMKRNRKVGGYNLRKSLAWDKAFFTEEGVLSNLELSMICGTPSKLDGKYLPVISEEQRTLMHSTTPTGLQTVGSKSLRKLHYSRTKENIRTGEGSIGKQKSLASGSLTKKSASTASAKKSERKEGGSLNNRAPTSHKRLLSTSPAKPVTEMSRIPRMSVLKPDAHLSSMIPSSSDASHVKRNRIAPPAPSVQKNLGQKGKFNTRNTSNAPKIVSQRISKPSKPSDQRTRKNRTVLSSRDQSSNSHKLPKVKDITSSEIITGKILPVGLEANDGTSKAADSVRANTGNNCNIGQSVKTQVAKPSGLRMPSPSSRFFSETKISMPNSVGQKCNAIQSKIPKATRDRIPDSGPVQPCSVSSISHNPGATENVIQSKIPKVTMERVSVQGPVQPCSVSSISSPKIHDEPVQYENDVLNFNVQALLYENPLEQISDNCLEEVGVEHGHTSLTTMGVDGKHNGSVSPIQEFRYNDTDLFQSSEDHLSAPRIHKKSDSHDKQGQNNLPVMSTGFGLESDVQEYSVHTSIGSNCYLEIQELQCPSHVGDEVYDGLSSNMKEPLKRSFSPERTLEIDTTNSIIAKDGLIMLHCRLPLMETPVQIVDGSIVDDDNVSEPPAEDYEDLPVAEYIYETDLTDQNADCELHLSARTSQTDTVICDAELSLPQAQGLGSASAELSTFESDQQHITSDEVAKEPLMPDEATSASLISELCSKDLVTFEDTELKHEAESQLSPRTVSIEKLMPDEATTGFLEHERSNEKARSGIVKDGKSESLLVIRPPADVAPFSDEWLAIVEEAGEDILTLKTGPVQNSPPTKLSPEPSPWSPVKRKNNQGIGPYDCTKYTGEY